MEEARRPVDADSVEAAAPEMDDTNLEEAQENPEPPFDPSLMEEAGALIDNARTYAEAELGFQKTRAAFAGRLIGLSLGLVIVAIILLHIAFLALAVGLVLAFEPLVGIWGSIGIVFGGLMFFVGLLGWAALTRAQKLASLFASPKEDDA